MKESINARVITIPQEEIIFGHEVLLVPFKNNNRNIVVQYIRKENCYLMGDGSKYNRNQFIPLAKCAYVKDALEKITILGRLQYTMQSQFKDGDIIHGYVTTIPSKLRLNDTVIIKDNIYVKGTGMNFIFGIVTDIKVTCASGVVEVTLPDEDTVFVPKRKLTIVGRASEVNIFNVTHIGNERSPIA